MINTNWCVITGGPSSGKTKVIEYLSFLNYAVIPEAARILIDTEQSKGKTIEEIRGNEPEFQKRTLEIKIEIENRIPSEQITFFDRGIPDSIAYYHICKKDTSPIVIASQKRKYKKIFLLDQLPFQNDYARTENQKNVHRLSQLLYKSYSDLGYNVIRVPVKPIQERVEFILSRM